MSIEKVTTEAINTTIKMTEQLIKKVWSVLEAAAEKEKASEYLSEKGIKAMQGVEEK